VESHSSDEKVGGASRDRPSSWEAQRSLAVIVFRVVWLQDREQFWQEKVRLIVRYCTGISSRTASVLNPPPLLTLFRLRRISMPRRLPTTLRLMSSTFPRYLQKGHFFPEEPYNEVVRELGPSKVLLFSPDPEASEDVTDANPFVVAARKTHSATT